MNGVNGFHIGVLIRNPADRPEHILHGLAQIFPAVGRDHNQAAILCPFQFWVGVVLPDSGFQRIDGSIAGDVDRLSLLAFVQQILLGKFRGSKIVLADDTHSLPVEFLRIGAVNVVSPQTGFHMAHRNLQVEAGQGGNKGCGGIAVNQHHIRLHLF